MNIIITGGNGFLGSKLLEKFIDDGHSITIIDKKKNRSINYPLKSLKLNFLKQISLH